MKNKFNIVFSSKRVQKELEQFSKTDKSLINEVITSLASNPRPTEWDYSQIWKNTDVKRIKVKRARIFYTIDESAGVIQIGKIENRESHSYSGDPKEWFRKSA